MIKWNLFPAALDVARFALGSEFAFVFIVFLVTRKTICFQLVFVQITFVTSDTFRHPMLTQQRVFGFLVMVKRNFFPITISMAVFTFGSKGAFVLVNFLMAGNTLQRCIFIGFHQMAIFTLDVDVLAR
jgi:hypothetical protein